MSEQIVPSFSLDGFTCPHCQHITQQIWFRMLHNTYPANEGRGVVEHFFLTQCARTSCQGISIWQSEDEMEGIMLYPQEIIAPFAHELMPDDVKNIFEEARCVLECSNRAASALLRLAVEMLMPHLDEDASNLNQAIGNLVKNGLHTDIQRALDGLRVIGNNSIHPGRIDITDDRATAISLFHILNSIVERTIGQEKRVEEIYEQLPQSVKEQIEKRDKPD